MKKILLLSASIACLTINAHGSEQKLPNEPTGHIKKNTTLSDNLNNIQRPTIPTVFFDCTLEDQNKDKEKKLKEAVNYVSSMNKNASKVTKPQEIKDLKSSQYIQLEMSYEYGCFQEEFCRNRANPRIIRW